MTLPIRTEPEAAADLEETVLWYEDKREGLGLEFLEIADRTLGQISRWPQSGAQVPGIPTDLAVRRVPLQRFPYHVVYVELNREIRVLAFAHDRRAPKYWSSRTPS